jgi:demethoxyubiquinone hydroxylase (CLK1/Coq7/Cat5 family)
MICTANFRHNRDNSGILREIWSKLDHFKDELPKLKEATSILELVLWKMKIDKKSHQDMSTQSQKKVKTDESSIRQQCRITCGADVIIGHMLPFLIKLDKS